MTRDFELTNSLEAEDIKFTVKTRRPKHWGTLSGVIGEITPDQAERMESDMKIVKKLL